MEEGEGGGGGMRTVGCGYFLKAKCGRAMLSGKGSGMRVRARFKVLILLRLVEL